MAEVRDTAVAGAPKRGLSREENMAANEHVDVMPNATKTYANFLALIKFAIWPIVLIAAFVVWLIA